MRSGGGWSVKRSTSTQTTLMYPARGAATVREADLGSADLGSADLRAVERGIVTVAKARDLKPAL